MRNVINIKKDKKEKKSKTAQFWKKENKNFILNVVGLKKKEEDFCEYVRSVDVAKMVETGIEEKKWERMDVRWFGGGMSENRKTELAKWK